MEHRSEDRNKSIIRYNIIGIVMNLALSVFKITAGLMAHAHAVMLDGVNSLSDMISFVAVPDYSAADSDRIIKEFTEEIKSRYPGMTFDRRIGVDM